MTSRARTAEELRDDFMYGCRELVRYWAGADFSNVPADYTPEQRLSGLVHSLLCMIDGVSRDFPCSLDLVCRPHPDDKAYHIDEDEDWIEDGTVLNANDMLHELLYLKETP